MGNTLNKQTNAERVTALKYAMANKIALLLRKCEVVVRDSGNSAIYYDTECAQIPNITDSLYSDLSTIVMNEFIVDENELLEELKRDLCPMVMRKIMAKANMKQGISSSKQFVLIKSYTPDQASDVLTTYIMEHLNFMSMMNDLAVPEIKENMEDNSFPSVSVMFMIMITIIAIVVAMTLRKSTKVFNVNCSKNKEEIEHSTKPQILLTPEAVKDKIEKISNVKTSKTSEGGDLISKCPFPGTARKYMGGVLELNSI